MIEQHRWPDRELVSQSLLQFGSKLNSHQRIKAHLDQRPIRLGRVGSRKDSLQRFLNRGNQKFTFSGTLQLFQLADKLRITDSGFPFRRSKTVQHRRRMRTKSVLHSSPIDVQHSRLDDVVGENLFHRSVCFVDRQRRDALQLHPLENSLVVCHPLGPWTPVDASRWKAHCTALPSQSVEISVGRGVVALSSRAEHRSNRRIEDKEIKLQRFGELVKQRCSGDFGCEDFFEARPILLSKQVIVDQSSSVNDAREFFQVSGIFKASEKFRNVVALGETSRMHDYLTIELVRDRVNESLSCFVG